MAYKLLIGLLLFHPFIIRSDSANEWVAKLSLEEKVGQLFVCPVAPSFGEENWSEVKKISQDYHVSSWIIYKSTKNSNYRAIESIQKDCIDPPLWMMDGEWGAEMRVKEEKPFPFNLTLSAIGKSSAVEKMGASLAYELKQYQIPLNLGPVLDINSNPKNPIIHLRSFGEDPDLVARQGVALIRGIHSRGGIACAKHFPGHGDTEVDSHLSLPTIHKSKEELHRCEWIPFQAAIREEVDSIMIGHLYVPSLDTLPASLSKKIIIDVLRNELGFTGIVISDALNMGALTNFSKLDDVGFLAHKAGSDLLLYGDWRKEHLKKIYTEDIPKSYARILNAYKSGELNISDLDARLKEIYRFKNKANKQLLLGLKSPPNIQKDKKELFEQAITQLGKPLTPFGDEIGYLSLGEGKDELSSAFCPCGHRTWLNKEELFEFPSVVVSIRPKNGISTWDKHRLTKEEIEFLKCLSERVQLTICSFISPYALDDLPKNAAIILGYQPASQKAVLKVIRGSLKPSGTLPIHSTAMYKK